MWYDSFKDEQIVIQQNDESNKFWAAHWNDKTNQVFVRWGRLGTKGQSQVKSFPTQYSAVNFINTKFSEKQRKGYHNELHGKVITHAMLDRLHTEAAIVGTQNKCHDFKWVELTPNGSAIDFKEISEDRLYDPDCSPGILVVFETRKEIDNRDRFTFLFTLEQTYDVRDSKRAADNMLIKDGHPLRKMVVKVEEAIGRSLAT
jgi:predicted DNA-binding WGR domain protein